MIRSNTDIGVAWTILRMPATSMFRSPGGIAVFVMGTHHDVGGL